MTRRKLLCSDSDKLYFEGMTLWNFNFVGVLPAETFYFFASLVFFSLR